MPFTHTIACEDRDFPEWHGGRRHALVWALELHAPELQGCLADARSRLKDLLLPRYDRQPHVTIAFAGLAAEAGLPGYDEVRLAADLSCLSALRAGPIELRASKWNSFPMVPYLAVESAWLHHAHAALDDGEHPMDYVPHLTVGHWAGRWPRHEVLARLEAPVPTETWHVVELSLLRYDTPDIAGPLEVVGRFNLANAGWEQDAEL